MVLSERVRRLGHSPTLRVSALAARLRSEGVDVLDFSAGQPDFPTPEDVKAAGQRAIEDNHTRYTANEGIVELRQAIADKLERDNGLRYPPAQILVSPGAKASLYFAILALCDPGDEVLVPSPYWVSYPVQIKLAGATPVVVSTREEDGYRLTAERLARAVTPRARGLILNYPANPTGACYTRDELAAIGRVAVERDLWIVADEIYEKLVYDDGAFCSIAALGDAIRERCVTINGMSKAYSMTGWRIGYAAGPADVISSMAKLQSHSTSNPTSISQWASVRALTGGDREIDRRRREFQRRRDAVLAGIDRLPGIHCPRPGGAFYAFPNVSAVFGRSHGGRTIGSGEDFATFLLEEARVAVVPGEPFGAPENVRISYAASLERVEEGMARIGDALARLDPVRS